MVIQHNTKQTSLWEMGRIDNNPIYGATKPLLRLSIHKDMSVRLVNHTSMLCQMCGPKHHHTVVRTFAKRFQPLPVLNLLTKQPLHSYESLNVFYLFLSPLFVYSALGRNRSLGSTVLRSKAAAGWGDQQFSWLPSWAYKHTWKKVSESGD